MPLGPAVWGPQSASAPLAAAVAWAGPWGGSTHGHLSHEETLCPATEAVSSVVALNRTQPAPGTVGTGDRATPKHSACLTQPWGPCVPEQEEPGKRTPLSPYRSLNEVRAEHCGPESYRIKKIKSLDLKDLVTSLKFQGARNGQVGGTAVQGVSRLCPPGSQAEPHKPSSLPQNTRLPLTSTRPAGQN